MNKYYKAKAIIDAYVDENGKAQTFSAPAGLFVTDPNKMASGESHIYVADTKNNRVVVFDRDYNYVRTINKPESPILKIEAFKPEAIAVDVI